MVKYIDFKNYNNQTESHWFNSGLHTTAEYNIQTNINFITCLNSPFSVFFQPKKKKRKRLKKHIISSDKKGMSSSNLYKINI